MRRENVLWDMSLIFNPDGKTQKPRRHVQLSEWVRDLIKERAKGTAIEWVFASSRKRGAHISYFPVTKQVGKARKAGGASEDIGALFVRNRHARQNCIPNSKIAELVNPRNAEHCR